MMSNFEDKRRAEAQRVADQDHREQVESEIKDKLQSMMGEFGYPKEIYYRASAITKAIHDGLIPHVKIEY